MVSDVGTEYARHKACQCSTWNENKYSFFCNNILAIYVVYNRTGGVMKNTCSTSTTAKGNRAFDIGQVVSFLGHPCRVVKLNWQISPGDPRNGCYQVQSISHARNFFAAYRCELSPLEVVA